MSDAAEMLRVMGRPVAHSVNNAMMVLEMNLDALARDAAPDTPAGKRLDRAAQGAKALKQLVMGYLALARPPEVRQIAPGKALEELRPLLELAGGRPGVVTLAVEPGAPVMGLDRPAFDLALVALVREAGTALPRGTGFTLTIGKDGSLRADFVPSAEVVAMFREGAVVDGGLVAKAAV